MNLSRLRFFGKGVELALYYLDSSALVKLYVREPGTDRLLALVRQPQTQLCLLTLAQVELRSAVRRREREGEIPSKVVDLMLDRFEQHLRGRFFRQTVTDRVISIASVLIDRHVLRAYDALQLAGCLVVREVSKGTLPVFACADQILLGAARLEKLSIFDPCARP